MMQNALTTPFGRRTMSLAMASHQLAARKPPPDSAVNKWQVFRHICEARERLGASDRALVVLNALLTFLPETEMSSSSRLIVFPSNAQLATRAHGMAPATLRRHLAALVEYGFIIRRDSPNGKRYARKSAGGDIVTAYGFDLTPLVSRASEFATLAGEVAEARRQRQLLRERITLARRDASKLLDAAGSICPHHVCDGFRSRLAALSAPAPRSAPHDALNELARQLEALRAEISIYLENSLKIFEMSASESQNERHIHNSEKEIHELEEPSHSPGAPPDISLGEIIATCPDITGYAPASSIRTWRELHEATNLARAALGVCPDLWRSFQLEAGPAQAAAVIAAILQKGERILRPGAYLHRLRQRHKAGNFTARPMLRALAREQLRTAHQTQKKADAYPQSLPQAA